MKRTISISFGKGSVNHNSRSFKAKNVDAERSHKNTCYCNESIKKVYHELFDEALEKYNAKQTRADRKIDNYYEKIRTSKQEKLFHEVIIQIGNMEDMNAESVYGEAAEMILDCYYSDFQKRNPNLRVFSAHLHMDEATPHLHIDFVPFTTESKRGLETRVSLKQALAKQGFRGGTRGDTELNQWVQSEKEVLAKCMAHYGVEWEQKGTHEKHLSVLDYKKQERVKEIAALEDACYEAERLKQDLLLSTEGDYYLKERMLDLKYENEMLKRENRQLKEKLEKAYDFMKQFVINGKNLLEQFKEQIREIIPISQKKQTR